MARAATPGLLLALCAAACATPGPPRRDAVFVAAEGPPQAVIERLRSAAQARGWRVSEEAPNALAVDFGPQPMDVAVPVGGLLGGRTEVRATEVHSSAVFLVTGAGAGSIVQVLDETAYWHADLARWLAGPQEVAPGADLARAIAREE